MILNSMPLLLLFNYMWKLMKAENPIMVSWCWGGVEWLKTHLNNSKIKSFNKDLLSIVC
jgi:hypothetical protein